MSTLGEHMTGLHRIIFGEALRKHRKTKRTVYVLQREGVWVVQGRKRVQESERYYVWQDGHFMCIVPNLAKELDVDTQWQSRRRDTNAKSQRSFGRSR